MASTKPIVVDVWGQSNTGSPDMVLPTYVDTGFPLVAGVPVKPPRGYINWLFNFAMNAVRYFCRIGIVEWDTNETDYATGAVVRDPGDGKVYVLTGAAVLGTAPHLARTQWVPVLNPIHRPIAAWDAAETYSQNDLVVAPDNGIYQVVNTPTLGLSPVGDINWICISDRFGFKTKDRVMEVIENWNTAAISVKSTGPSSGTWFGMWNYGTIGGGGAWNINATGVVANSAFPRGALVSLSNAGTTVAAASAVEMTVAPFRFMTKDAVYEVDVSVTGSADPLSNASFAFGIGDGTIISSNADGGFADAYAAVFGVGFVKRVTAGIWEAWTKPPGGAYSGINTGVSFVRNVVHRFRIEISGTGTNVLFYIDDVLVGTAASVDMTASGGMKAYPFFRTSGDTGGEVTTMNAGPLRIHARLF